MTHALSPVKTKELLQQKISLLADRQHRVEFWCKLASSWATAALVGLALVFAQRQLAWTSWLLLPLVVLLALVSVAVAVSKTHKPNNNWRELARLIEGRFPELDGRLLTSVQQRPADGIRLNYLQERLVQETLSHNQQNDWSGAVSNRRLALARTLHWTALAGLALVLVQLRTSGERGFLAVGRDSFITVTPGDTSLERGNALVVLARFDGALPPAVEMVIDKSGQGLRIPLVKSLADPMFGGSVAEVTSNLTYRVDYGGRSTRGYRVTVFDCPRLQRADVDLSYPAYTGEPHRHIDDTRRLSAVEGSSLDLTLQLNKPVASARLVARNKDRRVIALSVETNRPAASLHRFPLESSQAYDLELLDADGRTNKVPAQFVFDVFKNRPPEIRLITPRGDLRPSPLEEISLEGSVWDDFGVTAYGIGYSVAGRPTELVQLGSNVPGKQKRQFQHTVRLEDLLVKPDELVSWFVWAEDLGPDGKVRRTVGDLFFGEIRPFDEIFREGQGMDGQGESQGDQSGEGNQTTRLAELQKQIISATWNLQRKSEASQAPVPAPQRKNPLSPGPESRNSPLRQSAGEGASAELIDNSDDVSMTELLASSSLLLVGPGVGRQTYGDVTQPFLSAVTQAFQPASAEESSSPQMFYHPTMIGPASPPNILPTGSRRYGRLESLGCVIGQAAPADDPYSGPGTSSAITPRARSHPGALPNQAASSSDDIVVIRDSQSQALEQATAAAERARDPQVQALWTLATKEMERALDELQKLTNSPAMFKDALAAEQSAYQVLLKLQLHEYQVTRQRNRNRSGSSRQQQMERQLEQMELTQSEDRYENQRQAQAPQNSQRREQLQVMNRLQELARRQNDLNDRLKELQSALQEARTEEERAELQRRLKRLQEEEQQMLADVDELRQRMDRPENQSRMADERRQLDQTRQDIQRAAEAASQGAASQALAAGARAERQLQQLRDQLRKENSSQFAEDLRSMRAEARELARQQQDIQKGMQEESSAVRKSLSDETDHKGLLDQLSRQKGLMTNLLDRATEISQQAESSEPLLSSQLYDVVRKFTQESAKSVQAVQNELLARGLMPRNLMDSLKDDSQPDGAKLLDVASEMLRRDLLPQAGQAGQLVGARIDDLKRGIERAAESVLGDDTEALRLAQQELDQLTAQLQREIAQAEQQASRTNQTEPSDTGTLASQTSTNRSSLSSGSDQAQPTEQREIRAAQGNNSGQPNESASSDAPSLADARDQQNNPAGQSSRSANDNQAPRSTSARGAEQARSEGDRLTAPSQRGTLQAGNKDRLASASDSGAGGWGGWNFDRFLNDQPWRRYGPLTGEDFLSWSDRLREVEEIIELPDLRNEVAAARERARLFRLEFKRDRKKPDWAVVRTQVMSPLTQVRDRIADELARRQSGEALVPIDRDPVPNRYSELVRRYYEELGKDK